MDTNNIKDFFLYFMDDKIPKFPIIEKILIFILSKFWVTEGETIFRLWSIKKFQKTGKYINRI